MARMALAKGRLFETQRNKKSASHEVRWQTDQSETTVLMVLLLAFWRWLLPAPAMQGPRPPGGDPTTAAFAEQRRRLLAPIPVPLRRLLS
jgi:hypothetical protein